MGKRGNRSRNRNKSGKQSPGRTDGRELLPKRPSSRRAKRKRPFDPEKHFMPAAVPEREYDACAVSGEKIEDIYSAIAEPHSGKPARFDRVVERLRQAEQIGDDEQLVYLGRGAFGVVTIEPNDQGRKELMVHKRIQYEDSHERYAWRRELSPGISRDYVPQPEPITELYSREEIQQFPRFDASTAAHLSRGN